MFNWISCFWSDGSFTGPARNAPNNGIDIKKIFDQRPLQVICVSESQIKTELSKLRKTTINAIPPLLHQPPIMKEFDNVFSQGYKQYFIARKLNKISCPKDTEENVHEDCSTIISDTVLTLDDKIVPLTIDQLTAEITEFQDI